MGKTDRTLVGDDKAADMVPALALAVLMAPVEVPEALDEDMALAPAGVLGAVVVSEMDSVAVRAEVPVVLEEDIALAPAEVPVVPVVLVVDRAEVPVALVEDKAVVREGIPVFAAYRTDNTENRAADKAVAPALAEVLEASVEGLACVYDRRSRPA